MNYFIPFLAFLPGIVIARLFIKKTRLTVSILETILIGSIVWSYVMIVPSLILGLFTSYILVYFYIVTGVGLVLLLYALFILIIKLRGERFKDRILYKIRHSICENYLFLVCFSTLLVFILVISVYHPLFLEFDSMETYLSNARSIIDTASLQTNPYHLSSIISVHSPAVSILYSWIMLITNDSTFRLLPIFYFVLTGLVVFSFSKKLTGGHAPFIAMIVFASMWPVIKTFARFSLYPDITLTFYVSVAILFFTKGIERDQPLWYLFSGTAAVLAILTSDMGLIFYVMLLAIFPLLFALRFRKALFVVIATFMYYYYIISDLISLSSAYYMGIIYRQLPVILVSPILYYASSFKVKVTGIAKKSFLMFLIPSFLPLLLYIHNFVSYHMITESLLSAGDSIVSRAAFFFTSIRSLPLGLFAGNVTDYFHWDIIFTSAALGATFLVPIVIGFFSVFRKINKKENHLPSILLIWFIIWLLMWSINFEGGYQWGDIRRMYYMAPLFSVITAEGVCLFSKFMRATKYAFYLFIFYVTFMLAYMRTYFESAKDTFAHFSLDLSLIDVSVLALVFLLLFSVPLLLAYIKHRRKEHHQS